MTTFKRLLGVSLAAFMAASVVTGCSSSNGNKSSNANGTTEITAWFLAPAKLTGKQAVQDEVNKILEKRYNIKVKLVYYDWDSYQNKAKLALSGGEPVDVMFTAGWNNYSTFVGQGAFQPLDDLLEKYGQYIKKYINPEYLKGPVISGKLYAIPTNKDMASQWGVVINKKLADKYHMDFSNVKKAEDLEPFLQTIKDNEPGIVPFLADTSNNVVEFEFNKYSSEFAQVSTVGIPRFDSTKIVNILDDEWVRHLIAVSREFYKKGYYNSDVGTAQSGQKDDYKRQQKAFMWMEQLKPGKAEELANTYGYEFYQCVVYPDIPQSVTTAELTNSMLSIPHSSKHPEAAMKFINELFNPDAKVQNLLAFGIENKNYVKVSDNQIKLPDGVTAQTNTYGGIYTWAMGGNQLNDYLWSNESPDKWEKIDKWNKEAKVSKLIGFNYDTSKVQNEIAAVQNVNSQYWAGIASGAKELSSVEKIYREKLKTAGLQKIIDDVQSQVDAFLASNK